MIQRILLAAILILTCGAAWADSGRGTVVWDDDPLPADWPQENPFNILASMNCWTKPVLDHTGKPHAHGHVVQVIADGGNNIQDPPNPDGSPGGDDSLALGNFNMIRVLGTDGADDPNGKTGLFFSKKFFIPLRAERAYYLRIWEGKDEQTAPYYQDTSEYVTAGDRGGAIIRLQSGPPIDVDWSFGNAKPRPGAEPDSSKTKKSTSR